MVQMNARIPRHFGPTAIDTFHPLVWDQDELRTAMERVPPAMRNPPMPNENHHRKGPNHGISRERDPAHEIIRALMADGEPRTSQEIARHAKVSYPKARKILVGPIANCEPHGWVGNKRMVIWRAKA